MKWQSAFFFVFFFFFCFVLLFQSQTHDVCHSMATVMTGLLLVNVWFSVVKNGIGTRFQILGDSACANSFGIGKIGFFSLGSATSLKEGKFWIQTNFTPSQKLPLCHILTVMEWLRKYIPFTHSPSVALARQQFYLWLNEDCFFLPKNGFSSFPPLMHGLFPSGSHF